MFLFFFLFLFKLPHNAPGAGVTAHDQGRRPVFRARSGRIVYTVVEGPAPVTDDVSMHLISCVS